MINSDRPMPPLEGTEHRWVTVRGARLHIAESGSGEPVVLLHGFPQHWYAWRALVPLLADGHRLICVDLRGFGWSEQTGRGYDTDGLGDDVLALLDALGLDRVTLVGHNWGAGVGFRLCQRAPERFRAFLALNMAHPWTRHRDVLPNLWRMWFTAFIEYPVLGRLVLRHWPAFTRYLLRRAVADPAAWRDADLAEFTEAAQASAHAGQARAARTSGAAASQGRTSSSIAAHRIRGAGDGGRRAGLALDHCPAVTGRGTRGICRGGGVACHRCGGRGSGPSRRSGRSHLLLLRLLLRLTSYDFGRPARVPPPFRSHARPYGVNLYGEARLPLST